MKRESLLLMLFVIALQASVFGQKTAEEYLLQGVKLKSENKCIEALPLFIKAIELKPDFTQALYSAGWCQNELQHFSQAFELLQKADTLKKDDPLIIYELGFTCYSLENASKSISYYQKALSLDKDFNKVKLALGDVYRELKSNADSALYWYLKFLETDPNNLKANFYTGWCYNSIGRHVSAIPYLKKAIEIDNTNVLIYTELGFSYYSTGQYENAIETLLKTEAAKPRPGSSVYYLGLCYVKINSKSDAIKKYNELVLSGNELATSLLAEIRSMQ